MTPFTHVPPWLSPGNPESPGIPIAERLQALHGRQQGPNRGGKITADPMHRPFRGRFQLQTIPRDTVTAKVTDSPGNITSYGSRLPSSPVKDKATGNNCPPALPSVPASMAKPPAGPRLHPHRECSADGHTPCSARHRGHAAVTHIGRSGNSPCQGGAEPEPTEERARRRRS